MDASSSYDVLLLGHFRRQDMSFVMNGWTANLRSSCLIYLETIAVAENVRPLRWRDLERIQMLADKHNMEAEFMQKEKTYHHVN